MVKRARDTTASSRRLNSPAFSPDSAHVAYAAMSGKKMFMVADGKKGTEYDATSGAGLQPRTLPVWAISAKQGDKFVFVEKRQGRGGLR
jgi:Tol biopolymer transport system component